MERRTFIGNTLAGGALISGGVSIAPKSALARPNRKAVRTQENGKYDILLKGGHVIDPANNINRKNMDVAVADGKIAAVGRKIPVSDSKKTVDVSGLYVSPGFLDNHIHAFYTDPINFPSWINPDELCIPYGVTTALDVGSSGAYTFGEFKKIIDNTMIKLLVLLNISSTGMGEGEQDPSRFNIGAMVKCAQRYPDIIVGFKTAHYWVWPPYDNVHTPWASVDALVEGGRRAELPVMFDFHPRLPSEGYAARSYRELILEKGRPGDIHTHCYAQHIPALTPEGKVNPDVFKAKERGFLFDLGHGGGSFVWRNAIPAIEQGYLPDSISTDLHRGSRCFGGAVSMMHVMSKILSLGVPLEEVIRMSTINPALHINRPDLGSLTVGHTADIAVYEKIKGNFSYMDTDGGGREYGKEKLQNIMTVLDGEIVYDPAALSFLYWKDIPKDNPYWVSPQGQLF